MQSSAVSKIAVFVASLRRSAASVRSMRRNWVLPVLIESDIVRQFFDCFDFSPFRPAVQLYSHHTAAYDLSLIRAHSISRVLRLRSHCGSVLPRAKARCMMKLQISTGHEITNFVPVLNYNSAAVRNANPRFAEPLFIGASTENPKTRIKTIKIKKLAPACPLAGLFTINALAVQPLGNAITYQGRLMDGGVPANGTYDLGFVLHDDPASLTYIGNSIMTTAVPVSNGLFTVQLNTAGEFGPNAFNGQARWLEVDVRTNNNILLNNFTVLSPRQLLTPTPHAAFALNSSNATFALNAGTALNASFAATVADGSVTRSEER